MKVTQNTMTVFERKTDICDKKRRIDMVKLPLAQFGIPNQCPITSNFTYCCSNEKILTFAESTQKMISAFPTFGREYLVRAVITHDTGKSCFETDFEVVKPENAYRI